MKSNDPGPWARAHARRAPRPNPGAALLQRQVQMTEGFLLGNDLHMVLRGVLHQFLRFIRSDGPARRRDVRQAGIGIGVLHVGRDDIDFVFRQQRDVALERGQGGNGAAADVEAHSAPSDGGPIDDANRGRFGSRLRRLSGDGLIGCSRPGGGCGRRTQWVKQLPQRLHSIKNPGARFGHDAGLGGRHDENVAFHLGLGRKRHCVLL